MTSQEIVRIKYPDAVCTNNCVYSDKLIGLGRDEIEAWEQAALHVTDKEIVLSKHPDAKVGRGGYDDYHLYTVKDDGLYLGGGSLEAYAWQNARIHLGIKR